MDSEWSIKVINPKLPARKKLIQVGDKIFAIYKNYHLREGETFIRVLVWDGDWNDDDKSNWKMINYPADQEETQIPRLRFDTCLVAHKNFIYLWGGYFFNAPYYSDRHYLYQFNTETNIWTKINIIGFKRVGLKASHLAVVVDEKIIIFSGQHQSHFLRTVFSLDLNNFTWNIIPIYPPSFSFDLTLNDCFHIGVENHRIFFISKSKIIFGNNKPRMIYFYLDLLQKQWKIKNSIFKEFPEGEIISNAYSFNGLIYLLCKTTARKIKASYFPVFFDYLYLLNPVNGKVIKKKIPAQKSLIVDCFKLNDKIIFFLSRFEKFSVEELYANQHMEFEAALEKYGYYDFVLCLDLKKFLNLQFLCIMEAIRSKLDISECPKLFQKKIAKF